MGYSFVGDFVSSAVSFPGRCPITGRFMSTFEFDDDEPLEHFFGIIDVATEEVTDSNDEESDDILHSFSERYFGQQYDDLSAEEQAEFNQLNDKYKTDYWHPKDLVTLRRLDGLRWVKKTYGKCLYGAPEVNPHMGCSGFGANDKSSVMNYGYDDYLSRRGHDDTRKSRKATIRRFRRSARKLRTVEHTLSLLY